MILFVKVSFELENFADRPKTRPMVHKERHIVNVDPFVKNGRVDDILDRIEVFVCRFQTDSRNEHAYRKFEGFVFKPQVDFLDLHRNVGQDLIQSIQTISRRS